MTPRPTLPTHLRVLITVFFAANLTHFIHNAEYIAFYPGIPSWLTRDKVYLAWVAGAGIGLLGLLLARTRLRLLGVALIAAYGALGIDGLAHYTLALCSEHTVVTNLTIWFEVTAGLSLLLASAALIGRTLAIKTRLAGLGQDIYPPERRTPEALGAFHKAEIAKWWPIIKAAGIKAE